MLSESASAACARAARGSVALYRCLRRARALLQMACKHCDTEAQLVVAKLKTMYLEEKLQRECAAHERTLTSVLAQFEELFKEQRRATESGILHDPHHAPHRIAGHHMLALATKLESEGQYDEAQRVKEKAYGMCTSAGIYFG